MQSRQNLVLLLDSLRCIVRSSFPFPLRKRKQSILFPTVPWSVLWFSVRGEPNHLLSPSIKSPIEGDKLVPVCSELFGFTIEGFTPRNRLSPEHTWKVGHLTPRTLLREDCFLLLSLSSHFKVVVSLVGNQIEEQVWSWMLLGVLQSCQGKERVQEKGNDPHCQRVLRALMEIATKESPRMGSWRWGVLVSSLFPPWRKLFQGRKGGAS